MSQSATLYRISKDTFRQLKESTGQEQFDISLAKNYAKFQGSFMGLKYVLSKGQYEPTTELVNKIFNPQQSLGKQDFDSLTPEEQFELYETQISYLDTDVISKLNNFLNQVSDVDIQSKYDADELNENGIYPEVWHNENSPNQAFNELQLLQDFGELKKIINQADKEGDYILVFVG